MTTLNLGYLATFRLVIQRGSFSAAADLLGISQPAVSLQIRQLEQFLQTRLVTLPVNGRALEVMPVMDEEFVFIASREQQDAFRELTPEALHAQPLIAFESGSGTRALIDGWFAANELTIATVMQLGSIEAIKRMVRVGLGYSIVPRMAVEHDADREGLCVMSLTPMPQRQLAIVMRQDKILSKGIAGIIRLVQNPSAG
ncbi:LysR family transcriptional regulator [Enterobacter cloacae]